MIFDRAGKASENRTFQGQVFLIYFARSRNPCNPQNSKHKNSEFALYGLGFLHIRHSSTSRVIETHTNSKIWQNWILIVRETYGKSQTFQSYKSLTYFMWDIIKTYNSQNMGKVNSHSTEKKWENTDISKLKVSYIFLLEKVDFRSMRKVWQNANISNLWVS